jgi:hypothetical protein
MIVFEQMQTVVTRVRAEYSEMPGLSLTPAQAARLLGLERAVAADVLGGLLQSGFLACTKDGRFVHADTVTLRRDGADRPAITQVAVRSQTTRAQSFVPDWLIAGDHEGTIDEPSDDVARGRKEQNMTPERDGMAERGRALEDEYFWRRDKDLVAQARERAAEEQARRQFAAAVGVEDAQVLATLQEAGLDVRTAALLEIVPAVHVAWADDRVTDAERREIGQLLESGDLQATAERGRRLSAVWLDQRPSDALFTAALAALRARLARLDLERRSRLFNKMLADATMVGAASGGLLGVGAMSGAERGCLRALEAALTVES